MFGFPSGFSDFLQKFNDMQVSAGELQRVNTLLLRRCLSV